jgi:hypothetical protein
VLKLLKLKGRGRTELILSAVDANVSFVNSRVMSSSMSLVSGDDDPFVTISPPTSFILDIVVKSLVSLDNVSIAM